MARTGLLRAKWTARIHAEWIDGVIRQRPELDRARLERVAELMNSAVADCLVAGFEPFEVGLHQTDPRPGPVAVWADGARNGCHLDQEHTENCRRAIEGIGGRATDSGELSITRYL